MSLQTASTPAAANQKSIAARLKGVDLETYGPAIALVVLFVMSAILSPVFLRPQNLINILRQNSFVGIIAIGMTLAIISGGFDLSVGSMTALIGGLIILTINRFGDNLLSLIAGIFVGLGLGVVAGLLNGILITKGRIAPFVATLGTMAIFRSLTLYIADGGEYRGFTRIFPDTGNAQLWIIPVSVLIFLGWAVVGHILLRKTRYGRYVAAIGSNEKVAHYSAVNVDMVKLLTYTFVGLSVGLSSLLSASRMNAVSASTTGLNFELDAIAAAIIGGTSLKGGRGTVIGTVIGVLILGIINNMMNMANVSAYLQGAVKGMIIIAAVLIQRGKAN